MKLRAISIVLMGLASALSTPRAEAQGQQLLTVKQVTTNGRQLFATLALAGGATQTVPL